MFSLLSFFRSDLALSLIEAAGLVIAFCVAALFPSASRRFAKVEEALAAISLSGRQSILIVFLAALICRLAILPISPVPVPGIHDEYSYLLAGDTFAHGRLANPMSPGWEHFESFHILQSPTYSSMYPPAQGLFLALGEVLTGYAWAGVLLSMALLCAAVCWMLQAWMEPGWAMVGGLICMVRYGLTSYWIDSYWGGTVAALGGVLVIGALARALRKPSLLSAVLFSVGTFLLSSSRPYEGLVLFVPVLAWFAVKLLRDSAPKRLFALRFAVPTLCLLVVAGGWTLFYFDRVTGSPLQMPYQLNEKEYQISRPFVWQQSRPVPVYHHAVMREYYVEHARMGNADRRGAGTFLRESVAKLSALLLFYFWPGIAMTAIGMWLAWRRESIRFAVAAFAVVWAGLCLESWPMQLHYSAPILPCTMILTVEAARSLYRRQWRGRAWGSSVVAMYLLLTLATTALRLAADATNSPVTSFGWVPWATSQPGNKEKPRIIEELSAVPGKQLVLVHYSPQHDISREWVYNPADMATAKVIFAREMTPEEDRRLESLYPDRTVWELRPDAEPPQLQRVGQARTVLNTARR